jgi:tetratricopeptide (TPR) repeat protein
MQRPPDEPVVGQTAREACQRAGAKATVEGSIAALGTSYVVTLGVHNCQTGESLARAQGQADRKEDVLRALGTALTTLRTGLGESLASIAKYDVPVADATTTSLEALRLYGQGLRARAAKGDAASIPFFTQAAEKDPGFALAYAKLGVVMGNLGQADSARQFAQKAYDLRDKVSEYERLYINWNHASRVLADPVAVKEALELLTASYPRDFAARNNLGVYYNGRGQFEEALAQYQQAIAIAPDEPAPVANAAYVALALDRVEEAYGLMDRALAMRPDGGLAVARWQSAAMARDARAAEFEADAVKLATEEQVLTARASLALWFGQFKAYDRFVDDLRALARKAKRPDSVLSLDIGQTITRGAFLGGAHVDAMEGLLKTAAFPTVHAQVGAVLAMVGRVEPGRRLLPSLLKAAANNQGMRLQTTIVQAYVLAADGKPQEAVGLIEAAIAEVPRAQELYYHVGQIKERASDLAGAIAAYRTVVRARMSIGASPAVAAARIALGAALVKSGDAGGAEEQFATLRDQWRDADTDFPMLTVVRGKK